MSKTHLEVPLMWWKPSDAFVDIENDLVSAFGELCGTFVFLLTGLGGIQAAATSNLASLAAAASKDTGSQSAVGASAINTVASITQLTFISVSMGLSLLFAAWIFYRATGAAFNPNVSLALMLIGVITPTRFVLYAAAQLVGAIVASAVLDALTPGPLAVTPALGAGTNLGQGLFIECFITCALVLSVLFLAVEKHRATFLAPVGIGITLFAGHMFGTIYTGAAMNTARAFGPAVVSGFSSDHWVYWLGPTMGSVLAVVIYAIMKRFKYWKLNAGQDTDVSSASPALFFHADPKRPVRGPLSPRIGKSESSEKRSPKVDQAVGQESSKFEEKQKGREGEIGSDDRGIGRSTNQPHETLQIQEMV